MARKGENIYKRKDGRWEARYEKGRNSKGQIIYGSLYGKSYREVREKKINSIVKLPVAKTISPSESMNICDVSTRWLESIRHTVKESTYSCYLTLIQKHIQKFYYDLYLERPELWKENSQNALRGLETLSIPGRTRKQVEYPFPWDNALLYFRRSAANAAIAAAKSYMTRSAGGYAGKTETFHSAVTYYKGMYRELTSHGVELRVWTGDEWHWMHCRLYGKEFPEDGQLMSPSVVYEHPYTMFQVPVKEVVQDASGIKERIAAERNVCGVQFGTKDVFAVASVLTADGKEAAVRYFKGGNRYTNQCRRVVEHIDKSHASHGENGKGPVNQRYWMQIKHLNSHYAHQISREIVEYCRAHEVGIIAFPKYAESYEKHVKKASGNYSALHLSTRIREYLTYKAWQSGILVIDINAKGLHEICAVCGANIVSVDKKTQECTCEAGHKTNRYLNIARNTAKRCLAQFQKKQKASETAG